jgi:hypothetical protein
MQWRARSTRLARTVKSFTFRGRAAASVLKGAAETEAGDVGASEDDGVDGVEDDVDGSTLTEAATLSFRTESFKMSASVRGASEELKTRQEDKKSIVTASHYFL